jgi:hypothetical protein
MQFESAFRKTLQLRLQAAQVSVYFQTIQLRLVAIDACDGNLSLGYLCAFGVRAVLAESPIQAASGSPRGTGFQKKCGLS